MNKEKFKYVKEIESLNLTMDCPQLNENKFNFESYRFTYANIISIRDFTPQALKPKYPQRILVSSEKAICNTYAISLFNNLDKAVSFFNNLNPRTKQLLGYKNIASGIVSENDGITTKVNKSGHFNLHEYTSTELSTRFKNCYTFAEN